MSKAITKYNQLPPNVKQAINNTAAKAAKSVVSQVQKQITQKKASQNRGRTTRTRNGLRIYAPNDVVETRSIAPVSYATTWTSGNKSLRVHQTEVIGRVSANSTWFPGWNQNYSVATFPINPANPKTFPWLSYIARLFDKYRFHGLRFIYVNSVSTHQEGNIMMSLDYDTLDAAPGNLIEASQLAKYKLTPIYYPADFSIPVNHPGNNPWLYTFDLSATSNTVDLKTYNLGNFFLALDGVPQDGKDYGYLAVEYDVELLDKNPATTTEVFASKTYDTGGIINKRARSNVDPADTMDVTIDWTPSTEAENRNKYVTISFSNNVEVGSKVRLGLYVTAPIYSDNGNAQDIRLADTTATSHDINLSYYNTPKVYTDRVTAAAWFNYDIIVPESKSVVAIISTENAYYCYTTNHDADPRFRYDPHEYSVSCVAFTYA